MKLVKQTIKHNPEAGQYGDCHRACLAMLLDFDIEWVPHFCDPAKYSESDWEKHQTQWLEGFGKTLVTFPIFGEAPLADVLASRESFNPGVPYILGCRTEVANHSVVVHLGEVLNPGDNPVVGCMSDGMWYCSYLGVS